MVQYCDVLAEHSRCSPDLLNLLRPVQARHAAGAPGAGVQQDEVPQVQVQVQV